MLKKLGYQLAPDQIKAVVNCEPGAVEGLLWDLQGKVGCGVLLCRRCCRRWRGKRARNDGCAGCRSAAQIEEFKTTKKKPAPVARGRAPAHDSARGDGGSHMAAAPAAALDAGADHASAPPSARAHAAAPAKEYATASAVAKSAASGCVAWRVDEIVLGAFLHGCFPVCASSDMHAIDREILVEKEETISELQETVSILELKIRALPAAGRSAHACRPFTCVCGCGCDRQTGAACAAETVTHRRADVPVAHTRAQVEATCQRHNVFIWLVGDPGSMMWIRCDL